MTLRLLVPVSLLERLCEKKGWSVRGLAEGRYERSLQWVQEYLIKRDPVLWAERYLKEQSDGLCWRLWDYQKNALRYQGDAVFHCGSEVGKTREIIARALWRAIVYRRTVLIGAAQDGHLDAIWEELRFQLSANPLLARAMNREETKRKPYRKITFVRGNRIYLRPAGLEGEAFRNLHPDDGYFDEAALVTNPKTWGNFFSRVRPGGETRLYSTPNGNTKTRYSQILESATPAEQYWKDCPEATDPLAYPPPGHATMLEIKKRQPTFLKIHWPKTIMPEPFFTPARRAAWLEHYGGEKDPEFQQHVMGLQGSQVGGVFSVRMLRKSRSYLPEYRHIHIIRTDEGVYSLSARKLNPSYRPKDTSVDAGDDRQAHRLEPLVPLDERDPTVRVELDDRDDTEDATDEWVDELRRWLDPRDYQGLVMVGGIDVGWSIDPTEIVLVAVSGAKLTWMVRVTLEKFDEAPFQRYVLAALNKIVRPELGWGMDATGDGRSLEAELRPHGFRGNRLTAIDFNRKTSERHPETLTELKDEKTGEPKITTIKHLATEVLKARFARRNLAFPQDPAVVDQFANHTKTKDRKDEPRYKKTDDHMIDAWRVLVWHMVQETMKGPRSYRSASVPDERFDDPRYG